MKIPNKINPMASLNTNEFKFEFSNQIYTAYFTDMNCIIVKVLL